MDAVNVFISSKQAEFVAERAVLADQVRGGGESVPGDPDLLEAFAGKT